MPTSTKPVAVEKTLETWRSTIRGIACVTRFADDGSEKADQIRPGQEFILSTEQRRRNQTMVVDRRNDPFTNGIFMLVDAPPGTEDAEALMGNTAALTDEEVEDILDLQRDQFAAKIESITAPVLLHRIWGVAKDKGAGPDRMRFIVARLRAVQPGVVMVGDQVVAGNEVAELQAAGGDTSRIAKGPRRYDQLDHLG